MADRAFEQSQHHALVAEAKDHLDLVPAHLRGGLARYFDLGMEPGRFLCAVLENDLLGAVGRCSERPAEPCLEAVVSFLFTFAPAASWGSREKRLAWQASVSELVRAPRESEPPPVVPVVPDLEVASG